MNKYLGILSIVALVGIAFFILHNKEPHDYQTENHDGSSTLVNYRLEEGLMFRYPAGDDDYHLYEKEISEASDPQLMRHIGIMLTKDFKDQMNRVGGEESPSWEIAVYRNSEHQSPDEWVAKHPALSLVHLLVGSVSSQIFAGADAVSYTIDGLYPNRVLVISHDEYIFVIRGAYLDTHSRMYRDFDQWLNSFVITPSPRSAGKIDIRLVCQNALSYTTFPSGEDAEIFVQECIDGDHPEIIKNYLESLGRDGAMI